MFHTFDGLDVTVKIATKDKDNWAILSAAASNPMVQAEAAAINGRLSGWAFKLPQDKVQQIVATRETLLKPLDSPAAARAPGALAASLTPSLTSATIRESRLPPHRLSPPRRAGHVSV